MELTAAAIPELQNEPAKIVPRANLVARQRARGGAVQIFLRCVIARHQKSLIFCSGVLVLSPSRDPMPCPPAATAPPAARLSPLAHGIDIPSCRQHGDLHCHSRPTPFHRREQISPTRSTYQLLTTTIQVNKSSRRSNNEHLSHGKQRPDDGHRP